MNAYVYDIACISEFLWGGGEITVGFFCYFVVYFEVRYLEVGKIIGLVFFLLFSC